MAFKKRSLCSMKVLYCIFFATNNCFVFVYQGNSVCQALKELYNEMSTSEDMSHPGYWGGIILVGRDVFVDVKSVRKKALEHTIHKSTQRIRSSVTMNDNRLDLDGNLALICSDLSSIFVLPCESFLHYIKILLVSYFALEKQ